MFKQKSRPPVPPNLQVVGGPTRRLLPSKSMEHAIGLVEALTFCFKQQPAPVPLTAGRRPVLAPTDCFGQQQLRAQRPLKPHSGFVSLLAWVPPGAALSMGEVPRDTPWDTNQQMREQLTSHVYFTEPLTSSQ
eukprot:gene11535-34247_t